MQPKCAECKTTSPDLVRLPCECRVHPACLERRKSLCHASGVPAFRCAQCWQYVWNAGKRRHDEEAEEEFKKLRM